MQYNFYIQDPFSPDPHYLFEAIIEQLNCMDTKFWRGIFAFVSRHGITSLLEDPDVIKYLKRGNTELIVGIDAITDQHALGKLREMENIYDKFQVLVFQKKMQGIFHPKVAYFIREDKTHVIIVGSGNLTPGGLKNNIEAYSIFISGPGEPVDLTDLERFIDFHSASLREIDDEIIEIAKKNRIVKERVKVIEEIEPEKKINDIGEAEIIPPDDKSKILIAEVPKAGDRWHQIHFNVEVNVQFFKTKPNSSERVYLFEKVSPMQMGPEEVRPIVFSETNKNIKIEFAAKRRASYPLLGRPILVVREIGTRIFHYMLLLPEESGHKEMIAFLDTHKSIGKGLRRCITKHEDLLTTWKNCPL